MGFGIGIVAAIVAFRKRNGQTRLKKLQKKLKDKPPGKARLYQYPLKYLLSILVIIALVIGFEFLSMEIQTELRERAFQGISLPAIQSSKDSSIYLVPSWNETQSGSQIKAHIAVQAQIKSLRKVLNYIYTVFLVIVIVLVFCLKLRIVTAERDQKCLKIQIYSRLGFKVQKSQYKVKQGDKIGIWEMGETRFTHTDYYYSVRIVSEKGSCLAIKKACMFDARDAAIRLADQLCVPFSTKIVKMGRDPELDEQ